MREVFCLVSSRLLRLTARMTVSLDGMGLAEN